MKTISLSIATTLMLYSTMSTTLHADWSWSDAYTDMTEAMSSMSKESKEKVIQGKSKKAKITFEELYPKSFYKTDAFLWGAVSVVTIAVAATTVVTLGATAVPGATLVGGMLGTTWTAGLATLGGGTLASGGFGMAGGAFVIATTTDLAIAGLASFIPLPENNLEGKNYNFIKIPLPKEVGSKKVLELYENIEDITEEYMDGDLSEKAYEKTIHADYINALNSVSPNDTPYDLLNGAILAYNLGKYEKSQYYLNEAKKVFHTDSSFIYYHQALLCLVDYDIKKAIANLNMAISKEPDVLNPYLLKTQIAIDTNQVGLAKDTIDEGLKNFDDENFQLNYIRAILTYNEKNYKNAIKYFEEALSNTTINEIEAECKIWIAKCYKHLNNTRSSHEWYLDAMSEIRDNKKYQTKLSDMYHSEEKND